MGGSTAGQDANKENDSPFPSSVEHNQQVKHNKKKSNKINIDGIEAQINQAILQRESYSAKSQESGTRMQETKEKFHKATIRHVAHIKQQ